MRTVLRKMMAIGMDYLKKLSRWEMRSVQVIRLQITKAITLENSTFTMPSTAVTLQGHQTNDSWKCKNCGKTDLAQAYKKGALNVEGLKGRTFDTWPQMLTRVVLTEGGEEQELVKPVYNTSYGYGSSGV